MKECPMRRFSTILTASLLIPLAAAAPPEDAKQDKLKAKAAALIDALFKEKYDEAGTDFDAAMQKALPIDKLKELRKDLDTKVGALKKQAFLRMEKKSKYDIVIVACKFEKAPLLARVVFDQDGKVSGLAFVPDTPTAAYKAPDYVMRDSFRETEVKVGAGEWELPGTLSIPVGDGPFPAVVLVHGSGPNDRDETILVNKPFRDLAWGLSSRGVAVLRYDKRTKAHADKFTDKKNYPSVKEEVIDDAVAAVALLRKSKEIDGKRIFVLGHSLGGTLAPRIGQLDPGIAGLVILAGASRPLEDLVLEQLTYIFSLDGPSDDQKAELEKIKKQVARVKDPKLTKDTPPEDLPLGAPAGYWLSLREARPTDIAPKLKQPMLILQGERDYQVTMDDFALWKKTLASRQNVQFKSYPNLNHLFMDGKGKAKPTDYEKVGHVAREVIDEIAAWVKKQ
jgi:dienelactone hydrolase